MSVSGHTLPKCERLSGQKATATLLREGRYVNSGCLRICWRDGENVSRIMVSVPKKLFKRAVKRNLLKRRIRESYRLQKDLPGKPVDILFIYTSPEVMPSETIFKAVGEGLRHIGGR